MSVQQFTPFGIAKENVFGGKNNVKEQMISSVKKTRALADVKNTVHDKNIQGSAKKSLFKEKDVKSTPLTIPKVAAPKFDEFYEDYECQECLDNDDAYNDVWLIPPVPRLTATDFEKLLRIPSPKRPYSPVPMSPGFSAWDELDEKYYELSPLSTPPRAVYRELPTISPMNLNNTYDD